MRSFNIYLATGLAACTLISCNSTKQIPVTDQGEVKTETINETEKVIEQVIYGEWAVTTVGTQNVVGANRPYVIFSKDETNPFLAKCSANDGCNYLNGVYAITPGGHLKRASEFISTLRMCPDAPYEMGISLALNNVTNYTIDKSGEDYMLHFKNDAGATLMTLRKYDIGFINGAWQVTAIGSTPIDAEKGVQIVIDIPEGRIHGNAGCNTMNGAINVDLSAKNAISFSQIATTRMMCPEMDTERMLLDALAKVASVAPGDKADTALLKDNAGQTLITLKRLNLK